MLSTNTYTEQNTTPYFYIIQHKITKKMYAGSRWKIGCNPEEFMKPNGYQTSSPIIKSIIKEEGLDIFDIIRIDTNCDAISVYDYESLFLQTLNCAKSDDWYNAHNNTSNIVYTLEIKDKIIATNLKKYGYNYHTQSKEGKYKIAQSNLKKYGVENVFQSEQIKEKSKQTNLEKYGYEFTLQVPSIKEKSKISCMEIYGFANVFQSPIIQEKQHETNLKKYGVENVFQSEQIKEKSKQTNLKKYGVENVFQSEQIKEEIKKNLLEKYGVDHISKLPFLSIIENKKTYAKNSISRHFPEFKKYY